MADVGCGPGQIARYLHERGARVVGIDLSSGMIAQARLAHPELEFREGDMQALDVPDAAWAAIVAFYSIIHIPPEQVPGVLCELRRALEPGGLLLLSFHIGDEPVHLDEWWERKVSVDFYFFEPEQMTVWLEDAGFTIEEQRERDPYAEDVEAQTRRCYLLARA